MENQNVLRNPTAEELEALRKKNFNTNIYKNTSESVTPIVEKNGVKLKPKNSLFEPDPVLYRLITTNNVIRENLTENHEIYVRRTSAIEDAILSSFDGKSEEKILDGINQIIKNCTKTELDVKSLPLSEKIPLFIFILSISVGHKFNGAPIPNCNTCTEETQVELDIIEDFKTSYMPPNDPNYPANIEVKSYPGANIILSLELPKIYSENILLKPVSGFQDHIDKILQIVQKIDGTTPDGKKLTQNDIVDVVTYLNEDDKDSIRQIVNDWTEKYSVIYETTITKCNNPSCCMKNKKVKFDPMEIIRNFITKLMSKNRNT